MGQNHASNLLVNTGVCPVGILPGNTSGEEHNNWLLTKDGWNLTKKTAANKTSTNNAIVNKSQKFLDDHF